MAEGGFANADELTVYGENFNDQSDEIEALCSIYEADPGRIKILSRVDPESDAIQDLVSRNILKIFVPIVAGDDKLHIDVYLPVDEERVYNGVNQEGTKLAVARSESGQRVVWSFEATYLPPICLHVTLPHTYPSQDPPSFNIMCAWLSPRQLSAVCLELDRLWYDNKTPDTPGMPILYTWLDWIQESCLSFLGIQAQLSVTSYQIDDDVDDCRVSVEMDDLNEIVTSIVRYNHEQEVREFFKQDHECEVCLERMPGEKFYLLLECFHHLCKECMKAHCELIVNEGSVQHLRCPSYKCSSAIPQYILQDALTEEQFKRYDTLALQKALDVMGDVIYCPRCNSVVIREPEQDLNLAHCLACYYSFCTECEGAWHQGKLCPDELERKEREAEKDANMKASGFKKAEYERLKKIQSHENKQSKRYIKSMSKPCPKCNSNIMKVAGCNFVHCFVCRAGFCWICLKEIFSYSHFAENAQCNTFDRQDDMIDNTDMRLVNLMQRAVVLPPPPPPVRKENEGNLIEQRLKINPDLVENIMRCLTCKQKNEKKTENNHIRCWNCSTQSCFMCKQKLTGAVGKHYSGVNSCPQHSKLEFILDKD